MKNVLFLILTFLAVQAVNAQSWALDPTFGTDGTFHTTVQGNPASAHSVVIQSDGKIVMVGETATYQGSVIRLNTDGTLDNSFGTNGTVLIPKIGQNDYLLDVAIQSDGKIVAAGYSHRIFGYDIILIRLNSDGTLDNTLGGSGRSALDIEDNVDIAESLVIQPDGKYLLGGYSDYEFVVVRLNPDGLPDDTFGGDVIGVAKTEFPLPNSSSIVDIALQSDGKIVAVGNTINSVNYNKFAAVRYNSDGTPDLTFGTDGSETYIIGNQHDFVTSVAIQSDGKILLGGHTYIATGPKYDIAVLRLNENGSVDNTFGTNGVAKARIVDEANYSKDIILQPDGKIIVAGHTVKNGVYEFGIT
ncbi:MAG: delta-60 repeat domain-containing protein, partial [Bacteroidales bacterium]|nr:delta-60 repeat domain-containing protein [Bacteroidales bacterium]